MKLVVHSTVRSILRGGKGGTAKHILHTACVPCLLFAPSLPFASYGYVLYPHSCLHFPRAVRLPSPHPAPFSLAVPAVPLQELKENTFHKLPALETLEISLTNLVVIEKNAFNLVGNSLKTLTFVDDNELVRFEGGFFQRLGSIENLKFVNLEKFKFVEGGFASMANLKAFTANSCQGITALPANLFESSDRLEAITFEYNFKLKSIDPETFAGAGNVKSLRLVELQSLTSLDPPALSDAQAERASLLNGLTGLTDLIIASEEGSVTAVTANSFAGLVSLERVELKLAALTKVDAGAFQDATNLQKVTISGSTLLKTLPERLFADSPLGSGRLGVQEIYLVELGIEDLPSYIFENLPAVTTVKISCCPNLVKLVARQFNLPTVEEIAIGNNPSLEQLESNTFAGCTALRSLAVTNNPNLGRLVEGTFDHAFDDSATSVVLNLAGNGFTFISSRAVNFDADGAPDQTIVVMSSAVGTSLDVCCAYEWMKLDRHFFTSGLLCTSAVPTNALIESRKQGEADGGGGFGAGVDTGEATMVDAGSVMDVSDASTEFGCCFTDGWAVGVEYMHQQTVGNVEQLGSYSSLDNDTKGYLSDFCSNEAWNGATKLSGDGLLNCTEGWASEAEGTALAAKCQPQLKDLFKTKFDPNLMTCIAGHCPSGSRLESIGRSYLLDCEPWLHADRSYATKHAVAEQHCVSCIVANCKVCDENYRHCDKCDAEHSLFVDPDTGVHSCVKRTECPDGFYSTDAHSTLVFDGADGDDDPTDMNLHECVAWTECGDGQKEESEATPMTDRVCKSSVSAAMIGGTVGGIVGVFVLIIIAIAVRHKAKVASLKEELTKLGKTLVGVRHVKTSFAGGNVQAGRNPPLSNSR